MHEQIEERTRGYGVLLVVGILLLSFNLRPAITSVGPLLGIIRDDVGFQNWSVAFLTSLPLVAFAIMSPLVPKLAHRTTNEVALCIGLIALIIGVSIRSVSIIFLIFLGTLLLGFGIAILNVLLPGVIKEKFPQKIAIMTSLYSTGMVLFATIATGLSIPFAKGLDLGWQLSLFVWVIPAAIPLFVWLIIIKKSKQPHPKAHTSKKGSTGIWKSPLAWQIALYMGFQSFLFYVSISWIAEILIDFGLTQAAAGFFVSYFQLLGIPVSFIMPILATRLKSQSAVVITVNSMVIAGIILLLWNQSFVSLFVSIGLIGLGSSSNFALSLTFLSIRARNAQDASALSGMAQSMGYILAAIGPVLIGSLYDLTGGWTVPLISLICAVIAIMIFGIRAGRDRYVFD